MIGKVFFLAGLLVLILATQSDATCLSGKAATLAVGEWTEVSDCMSGLEGVDQGDNFYSGSAGMFQYTNGMTWDAIGKKVYFMGMGHNDTRKLLKYDDATDTWTRSEVPTDGTGCPNPPLGHAYNHNTIDQFSQVVYHHCNDGIYTIKYDTTMGTYSRIDNMTFDPILQGALVWFPPQNKLFYESGKNDDGGKIYFWTSGSGWSRIGTGVYPAGDAGNFLAQYSPISRTILFGGGTSGDNILKIYRLNPDATVTALNDSPIVLAINYATMTVDPVTGKFLVAGRDQTYWHIDHFYAVDPAGSGTWTPLSLPPFAEDIGGNTGIGTTPISTYGVSLWCHHVNGSNARCYIFKYANPSSLTLPTVIDERKAYIAFGWSPSTWADGHFSPTTIADQWNDHGGYSISGDTDTQHYESEGDELWQQRQMAARGGDAFYSNRAATWLTFDKGGYVDFTGTWDNCVGGSNPMNVCTDWGFYGDHQYGWGLVAAYEAGDSAALTAATALGGLIEGYYDTKTPGTDHVVATSLRAVGRALTMAVRLAEATGLSRWITLRNHILDLLQQDTYWDDTEGMYSQSESLNGDPDIRECLGTQTPYEDGWRGVGAFQVGILAEGMYQAYRTTGAAWLKTRLIQMAYHVQSHALNPAWDDTGLSWFWNVNTHAKAWCMYARESIYTLSNTNILVLGYKYTGDASLLASAKHFFSRGSKFDPGAGHERFCSYWGYTCGENSNGDDDPVHHYVSSIQEDYPSKWMKMNKGELQYTYLLFENGGAPTVEGGSSVQIRSAGKSLRKGKVSE